jgi:hypothetical protein
MVKVQVDPASAAVSVVVYVVSVVVSVVVYVVDVSSTVMDAHLLQLQSAKYSSLHVQLLSVVVATS